LLHGETFYIFANIHSICSLNHKAKYEEGRERERKASWRNVVAPSELKLCDNEGSPHTHTQATAAATAALKAKLLCMKSKCKQSDLQSLCVDKNQR